MGTDQVVKFAIELWLFTLVVLMGSGAGTACVRVWRLPAYYWLPLTLASASLVSYGLFWVFLFDPHVGRVAAVACGCASAAAFGWQLWSTRRSAAPVARLLAERDAWLPGVLMLVLTIVYLFFLFARDAPVTWRFTWQLPTDNVIPLLFANWIEDPAGRSGPFLLGDWRTSDRPPLQAAVVLATRPFAPGGHYAALSYQVVATICQLGWVPVLYALLRQLQASRRQQIYTLTGCAFSGFFLIHSVFTWPKLLAAWLFLLAIVLLVRIASPRHANEAARVVPLAGVLLALSLLSHGATAFSLLALPALWLVLRLHTVVTIRQGVRMLVLLVAVMAPWFAYQKFYDPPGDRLLKWHLAGLVELDPRGTREAIVDQYATLTPRTWLAGRWANLRAQVVWDPRSPDETAADWFRRQQFFHHLFALDLLCLGFFGLWMRASAMHRLLRRLLFFALVTIVLWCLLLFTPGAAVIHQGSYVVTILLFVGGSVGLAALPRPIGSVAIGAHALLFAMIWLVTQPARVVRPMPWKPAQAAGALLFAIVFLIAMRAVRDPSRSAETQSG